jgi:cyclophilin family peptidyl-prolyl cis-trans isomerase/HEAT repeat protein
MKALRILFVSAALVSACSGEDAKVKSRLVEIAQWEDKGSIGPNRELVAMLFHPDLKVREAAVWALGRIQDPTTIHDLSTASGLDTLPLKPATAWAMGQMAAGFKTDMPEQALSSLYTDTSTLTRRNVIDGMGYLGGAETEQFLQIFGLLDGNPMTRGAAAVAMGRLGHVSDVRDLASLLHDQDPEVRWRSAWGLWRLKDARGKLPLEAALADNDPRVRMFAARGLAEFGDAESAKLLVPLLKDADWRVRNNVAYALGNIDAADTEVDQLVAALDAEQHELAAQTMAEAVGKQGRLKDLPVLKGLVRRRSATIWVGAINGMAAGYRDSAHVFVMAMLHDPRLPVAQAAIAALGQLRSEMGRSVMIELLMDTTDATRKGLVLSELVKYGFENVEYFIDSALASSNKVFALSAVDALKALPTKESFTRLSAFWTRHAADTISDFKLGAIETASTWLDSAEQLREPLAGWLQQVTSDGDRLVRKAAIDALGKVNVDAKSKLGEFVTAINEDTFDEIFRAFKSNPTATIETDKGAIVIELRYDKAPRTVHNFVKLAKAGFYNGVVFHRVVPNFVVQTGDPEGTGWGGPGYTIRSQYNDLEYSTGAVGMASSGKDTEGSQFFITHSPQPHLDDRYTLFGYVTSGQDVVDAIRLGDKVKSVTISNPK